MFSTVAATLVLALGTPAVPTGPAKIEIKVDDRDLTVQKSRSRHSSEARKTLSAFKNSDSDNKSF